MGSEIFVAAYQALSLINSLGQPNVPGIDNVALGRVFASGVQPASDALLEGAVADHDRAVLNALEDVENAYGLRAALDARVARLESGRDAAYRAGRSKLALFDAGQATRSDVHQARLELARFDDALTWDIPPDIHALLERRRDGSHERHEQLRAMRNQIDRAN